MKNIIQKKQKFLQNILSISLFVIFSSMVYAIDCDLAADAAGLQMNCNADGSYDICIDLMGINGVFEVVDHTNTATNITDDFTIPLNGPFNKTVCLTYPNYNIYNFCVRGITQAISNDPCDISLDFIGPGMCCEIVCDDDDCTNGLETWDAASCSCISNPPPTINFAEPQADCNADGSYNVCVDISGYDGQFEVVDHTNTATQMSNDFNLPINGSYNQTVCLTYPNYNIYNFCVREVVQTVSGEPCYLSIDFIGSGLCCEIECDDNDCTNGLETWDAASCQCVDGNPYPSCSGSSSVVACDDGDPCTENDEQSIDDCDNSICIPCAGTPVPLCVLQDAPSACDDGDPCTENDVEILDSCTGQVCVSCAGTPIQICTLQDAPVACNDGNPCTENDMKTLDSCTGLICVPCAGTPIPSCSGSTSVVACNDGSNCTTNDLQTIDDCDGSVCVPCAGTPSCDDDNTAPEITLNWGTNMYSGMQLNMLCDDITSFNENNVTLTDNCDDSPTVTFTDEFIEYGDCNTTGYLSKWRCYWTATDECGNESIYEIFVTLTCPSCNDNNTCTVDTYDGCDCVNEQIPGCGYQNYCTYPQNFYGNQNNTYAGATCSDVVNNALNSCGNNITIGLPGQSISVTCIECIDALLPSYGGVMLCQPGDLIYSGNCAYTAPLGNRLAAEMITLKLNILYNPDLQYVSINDPIGCVFVPQSVLNVCGGQYTVEQLCIIGDHALGGYYGNNINLLNDVCAAIILVNDGFSYCADPCTYGRTGRDLIETEVVEFTVGPNPIDDYVQVVMNLKTETSQGLIQLFNLNNQEVLRRDFIGYEGFNQNFFNLNDIPSGIYFITIEAGEQKHTQKLIKL